MNLLLLWRDLPKSIAEIWNIAKYFKFWNIWWHFVLMMMLEPSWITLWFLFPFYNLDKNPSGESEKIYYFLISFPESGREGRSDRDSNYRRYLYLPTLSMTCEIRLLGNFQKSKVLIMINFLFRFLWGYFTLLHKIQVILQRWGYILDEIDNVSFFQFYFLWDSAKAHLLWKYQIILLPEKVPNIFLYISVSIEWI